MLQRKKPYKSLKRFPVRNSIVRCFSKTRVHSYVRFLILVFKKCIIYIFLVIFRKFLTYKVCFTVSSLAGSIFQLSATNPYPSHESITHYTSRGSVDCIPKKELETHPYNSNFLILKGSVFFKEQLFFNAFRQQNITISQRCKRTPLSRRSARFAHLKLTGSYRKQYP